MYKLVLLSMFFRLQQSTQGKTLEKFFYLQESALKKLRPRVYLERGFQRKNNSFIFLKRYRDDIHFFIPKFCLWIFFGNWCKKLLLYALEIYSLYMQQQFSTHTQTLTSVGKMYCFWFVYIKYSLYTNHWKNSVCKSQFSIPFSENIVYII